MSELSISRGQANLKLALLNAEAESMNSSDLYLRLQQLGLPEEIVTRLHDLMSVIRKVGKTVIEIGKIVVLKILEFVKAHPFLVTGMGIGAVIGVAIASLITAIPIIGPFLSPIATALGLTITLAGAVIGHQLDKQFPGTGKSLAEIAQEFFALFASIINTVFSGVATA